MTDLLKLGLPLFLIAAGPIGCRKEEPQAFGEARDPAAIAALPADERKWTSYEDDVFRVELPEGWKIRHMPPAAGASRNWQAGLPDTLKSLKSIWWNSILVTEYPAGKETRPLERIYSEYLWAPTTVVDKPKSVRLGSADCLSYRTESTTSGQCAPAEEDGLGLPPAAAPDKVSPAMECIDVYYRTDCYAPSKKYYTVESLIMPYPKGKPAKGTFAATRTVERMLGSLQFK
ncbi:MAG: hypothetical protein WC728_17605 [Elusimicrobiota bacterium]